MAADLEMNEIHWLMDMFNTVDVGLVVGASREPGPMQGPCVCVSGECRIRYSETAL